MEKSERLVYNYSFSGDTLYLDEYFTIPADTKWSFDAVGVHVNIPVGTIVYLDSRIDKHYHSNDYYDEYPFPEKKFWLMTEDGLELIESGKDKK
jgi:hypothetical protein